MQAAAMRDHVRDRLFEVDPPDFEVLCKMVLVRRLETKSLQVTAFRQDDGIDVEGIIDEGIITAWLGVQSKRYSEGNTVSNDYIQRFHGALAQNHHQIGTYITTSSFSGPAVDTAEDLQICLVDGATLADIMVSNEIGVEDTTSGYEIHEPFWQAFDKPEDEDTVPSDEVPLANNFDALEAYLRAIRETDGSKQDLHEYVNELPGFEFNARHADLYAMAAWVLGFVHKDTPKEVKGREVRRWGLTREGVEYLAYLDEGNHLAAREQLVAAIREVEIIQRVYTALEDSGELSLQALRAVLSEESKLSESSVDRRGSCVSTWLQTLPEVERVSDGRSSKLVLE